MAISRAAKTGVGYTTSGGGSPTSNIDLSGLLKTLTEEYQETRTAKQKRYEEGIGILQNIVEQFGPGYLKGEEKRMLADMEQSMVGRGLSGTTRPAAVGMGIKADIRDRATQARTGAMTNVANFMAGFQDIYPQPGTLAHLATGGFSGLLQQALASAPGGPLGPTQVSSGGTFYERNISGAGGGGGGAVGGGSYGASQPTVSAGGSGGGGGATGAGAATYGLNGGMGELAGGGGSYTPQAGDYMNVEQGPGGPILGGGGQQSWGPAEDPNLSRVVTGRAPGGGYIYGYRGGGNV